jgi:3-deoxy-D-manno-octulosonic-acid transferase
MIVYNILFLVSIVLALPVISVKVLTSGNKQRLVARRLGVQELPRIPGAKPVWVHALSVGEVLASAPLVRKIREVYSSRPVVLSVSTATGHEMADRLLGREVESIFFFPYDLIWSVRKVIRTIDPAVFVLVESDIWPNFIYEMKRRAIPFILVNGRMSPRSFWGYRRVSFFMRRVFSNISTICAQTETDAKQFVALGVAPDKVHITGNIKFDQALVCPSHEEILELRASMGITPGAKVLVAGSTHQGEEEVLMRCFRALRRSFQDLVLVLVPRDPGRGKGIQAMFNHAGFVAPLRTEIHKMNVPSMPEVIIVDTMGELRRLYAIADVVFVGKSLVRLGGQNPLEPAALKKPILFGPHMFNFELIARHLVREGGALQVADEEELLEHAKNLLSDARRSKAMGAEAYKVFHENRGAVDKTLRVMEEFL